MDARRIAIYAALAAAVLLVGALARTLWVVAVSAAVAAAVALWVHRSRGGRSGDSESEPAGEARRTEWIGHLERLAAVNAAVREHALSEAVIGRVEGAVDCLRRLVPELNEGYLGSELTWTVNRMAGDYLPRIVRPYVALSPGARHEHEAEFLASLEGLMQELENIEGLVRDAKVGDFKSKAAFLRARFLEPGAG